MSTAQAEIATRETSPAAKYKDLVQKITVDLLRGLVGDDRIEEAKARFTLAFRSAALAAPQLYAASPQSVAQALAMCALTGLMPGGPLPDCYLIPRKEKNPATNQWDVPGLQWMISWRGMQKLVQRTGARIRAVPVFHGEEFAATEGLSPDLRHVRDIDADWSFESLRAVYVVVDLPDGTKVWDLLGKSAIEKRRAASDSYKRDANKSPWTTWPIEMALKTGLRYAVSRGIAPIDETGLAALERDDEDRSPEKVSAEISNKATNATPLASAPKTIADRGGLDELEQGLAREPEVVVVDKPIERAAEVTKAADKSASKARGPKAKSDEKPAKAPADASAAKGGGESAPAPKAPELTQQHLELIATVKLGKEAVGGPAAVEAQKLAGIPPQLRPEDMTVEQLQAYDEKLNAAANAVDDQQGN